MAFGTRAFGQPYFAGTGTALVPGIPGFSVGYSIAAAALAGLSAAAAAVLGADRAASSARGNVVAVTESTGESVPAFGAEGHDKRSGS